MLRHHDTPTGVSRFLRGGLLLAVVLALAAPLTRAQDQDLGKGQQPLPGLGLNGPNVIRPSAPPAVEFRGELPAQTAGRIMIGQPSVRRIAIGTRVENLQPDIPASLVLGRNDQGDRVRLALPDIFRGGLMLLSIDGRPFGLHPIVTTGCSLDVPALLDLAQALQIGRVDLRFFSLTSTSFDVARMGLTLHPAAGLVELRL